MEKTQVWVDLRACAIKACRTNWEGRPHHCKRRTAPGGRRRKLQAGIIAFLVLLSCLQGLAAEQGRLTRAVPAKITYLTTTTIYINKGRSAGLEVGDRGEVLRNGKVVARLEVIYLAEGKASCKITQAETAIKATDEVRLRHGKEDREVEASPRQLYEQTTPGDDWSGRPPAARKRRRLRDMGLGGRVGFRYLTIRQRDDSGATFSQPSLDLRLDGNDLGGGSIDIKADVRARRNLRTSPDGDSVSQGQTRVYEMSAAWQEEGSPVRITAGRQFSPALATISTFDGITAEYGRQRWSAGALTGTQPDQEDFGHSTLIREHGVYLQFRNGPQAGSRWAATTGLIGSYQEGEINREFVYLQGRYDDGVLFAYGLQEVDVNRGWRKDAEGNRFSPTNTLLSLRLRVNPVLTFKTGYDNRRTIRLYRDFVTPETQFDDDFRQGLWWGADLRIRKRYRMGFDLRTRSGGSVSRANTYTLNLGASRLTSLGFRIRTRSSRYTNQRVEGWLHSLTTGFSMGARMNLDLNGGMRDENSLLPGGQQSKLTWYGFDWDINIGRHWFLLLSTERDRSSDAARANDQYYTTLVYRF